MFFNYGDSVSTLADEIKLDFYNALITAIGQSPFDRGSGVGLEQFVNESQSELGLVLTGLWISQAVANFNASRPRLRQIISSQDLVRLVTLPDGAVKWVIYFFLPSDISKGSALPNSITL